MITTAHYNSKLHSKNINCNPKDSRWIYLILSLGVWLVAWSCGSSDEVHQGIRKELLE